VHNWKLLSLVRLVIKCIVKRSDINKNFVNFYRFMFSRKLYVRAAAFHTWSMAVIISQECVIDLNRERVSPTTGGNRKRESERVIRNFGRADVRAARAERKKKERAMRVVNAAPPLLSGHEIYSEN